MKSLIVLLIALLAACSGARNGNKCDAENSTVEAISGNICSIQEMLYDSEEKVSKQRKKMIKQIEDVKSEMINRIDGLEEELQDLRMHVDMIMNQTMKQSDKLDKLIAMMEMKMKPGKPAKPAATMATKSTTKSPEDPVTDEKEEHEAPIPVELQRMRDFGVCDVIHDGKCFWLVVKTTYWHGHGNPCGSKGGKFAIIYDREHYEKIMKHIRPYIPKETLTIWLGMKFDVETEKISEGYAQWSKGYPQPWFKAQDRSFMALKILTDPENLENGMVHLNKDDDTNGALCEVSG